MPEISFTELKQMERDTRRHIILGAALDLFAEKDFKSVTVREIARRAGVSIGTIYNYYQNLTELFLDVFLTSAEDITRLLNASAPETSRDLEHVCKIYITFLNDNMTFYQMMSHFMLGGELSADGTAKLDETMKALMDRMVESLSAAGVRENLRLRAHALFSALNGIMISYARYPGKSDEAIRRHTLRLAGLIAQIFQTAVP